MSKSEFTANLELSAMCKREGYARMMFNLDGDIARGALRRHNIKNGTGIAKFTAKLVTFFIG